jgi:hypothetical protein
VADADRETAWRALVDVDLPKLGREAPVVGMLGALRMLPEVVGHLLHGDWPAKRHRSRCGSGICPRSRCTRADPARRAPGQGDCSGLVGRFWRPAIEFARITSAGEVGEFDEAGFAKTVYDLSVPELGASRTLLSGLMRTATTDEHARRWFRRYRTFGVGSARTSSSAPCSTRHGARPRASGTVS